MNKWTKSEISFHILRVTGLNTYWIDTASTSRLVHQFSSGVQVIEYSDRLKIISPTSRTLLWKDPKKAHVIFGVSEFNSIYESYIFPVD